MKALKLKSLKALLPLFLIMFLIGGGCLYSAVPTFIRLAKDPISLDDVDFEGEVEGLYVSGTLLGIYDWYCEEVENNTKVVSREYLIDADDYYYMGLRVAQKDMDAAEALLEASTAYLNGEDDGTALALAQYEVKGTITRMPDDSYELYQEYLGWNEMDAESRAMFLPYYLDVNSIGGNYVSGAVMLLVIGLIFLAIGLIFLILALSSKYQKSIRKYISQSTSPEAAREKVEYFLNSTPDVNGLKYNRDFICGNANGTTAFGEISKLVWVYKHTVTHKQYFITVGKTYSLMLCFADGTRQAAAVKKEAMADEHIQKLSELCPHTIFGYSEQLDKMFQKDLNGFLDLKYHKTNTGF